jgi:hypothetical protein
MQDVTLSKIFVTKYTFCWERYMHKNQAALCLSITEALQVARKVTTMDAETYIRLGCVVISTPDCKMYIMPANGSIRHEWSDDHCTDTLAIYVNNFQSNESRMEIDLSAGITFGELTKEITAILNIYTQKKPFHLPRRARLALIAAGL